jgi:hypothetical protein
MLRVGFAIILAVSCMYIFLFETGAVPASAVFPISFLGGLGIGALSTSYEIMVPEVILWEQNYNTHRIVQKEYERQKDDDLISSVSSLSPIGVQDSNSDDRMSTFSTGKEIMKENIIYGFVDSVRELSMSLSFFAVGLLVDHLSVSWAVRTCCGIIPIAATFLCVALHIYYPFVDSNEYNVNVRHIAQVNATQETGNCV